MSMGKWAEDSAPDEDRAIREALARAKARPVALPTSAPRVASLIKLVGKLPDRVRGEDSLKALEYPHKMEDALGQVVRFKMVDGRKVIAPVIPRVHSLKRESFIDGVEEALPAGMGSWCNEVESLALMHLEREQDFAEAGFTLEEYLA